MKNKILGHILIKLILIGEIWSALAGEDDDADLKLKLVQIVFRHGDRTPVNIYPNDPHKEDTWQKYGGLGQLTQLGMRQHYTYGNYLRTRYADFLDEFYNKNKVLVHSTDYDRTIMSAESLLTSLYKPIDYQVWNQDVKWQPIPVHTAGMDKIFISNCARYTELLEEVTKTPEYIKTTEKYQDLIDAADKNSGYPNICLKDLWKISDTVFVENNNNLTLPDWVKENFDKLMSSKDLDFYFSFYTTEMAKLTAGGILYDMKKNILNKTRSNSSHQLVLYSSHDTYVAGLTRLLNLTSITKQPPYTSSILVELYQSATSSKYFVKVYLKNNPPSEKINLILLPIYGCDSTCPLEDFLRIINDKVVEDPVPLCMRKSIPNQASLLLNLTFIISISFVTLVAVIVIILAISTCRRLINHSGYIRQEL